jgi:calcineurin-like phosphoesterase family protein
MNQTMVKNWNSVVKSTDLIYHLGDFGFSKYDQLLPIFNSLNGTKILIQGNHDQHGKKLAWASKHKNAFINIDNTRIYISHYPDDQVDESLYDFYLHGHCHGTLPNTNKRFDVGVDCFGFTPITLDQIKGKII